MKYTQKDSNSKGMVVELVKETDYNVLLKSVSSGMEYSVGKADFKKHYVDEAGGEPQVKIVFGKSEQEDDVVAGKNRKGNRQ